MGGLVCSLCVIIGLSLSRTQVSLAVWSELVVVTTHPHRQHSAPAQRLRILVNRGFARRRSGCAASSSALRACVRASGEFAACVRVGRCSEPYVIARRSWWWLAAVRRAAIFLFGMASPVRLVALRMTGGDWLLGRLGGGCMVWIAVNGGGQMTDVGKFMAVGWRMGLEGGGARDGQWLNGARPWVGLGQVAGGWGAETVGDRRTVWWSVQECQAACGRMVGA